MCSITTILAVIPAAYSHPGRLNSDGGHFNRETGVYHCHSAECEDQQEVTLNSNTQTRRYKRSEWAHWIDEDRDCQNTRAEILVARSTAPVLFSSSRKCRVVSGQWYGALTGKILTDASDLDIDHVIPLSYAHRNGGASWTSAKKQLFANDPENLLPTYDVENRKKSDKGPSEYMPEDQTLSCEYGKKWIQVSTKYSLRISEQDSRFLRDKLQAC